MTYLSPSDSAKQNEMEHQQQTFKKWSRGLSEDNISKTEKETLPQETAAGLKNVIQKSNFSERFSRKTEWQEDHKKGFLVQGKESSV